MNEEKASDESAVGFSSEKTWDDVKDCSRFDVLTF